MEDYCKWTKEELIDEIKLVNNQIDELMGDIEYLYQQIDMLEESYNN